MGGEVVNGFAWLVIKGGPWDGGTFYPGGEVVPGAVVKRLPEYGGCYLYGADGKCLAWRSRL